jgi:hypothetical protein
MHNTRGNKGGQDALTGGQDALNDISLTGGSQDANEVTLPMLHAMLRDIVARMEAIETNQEEIKMSLKPLQPSVVTAAEQQMALEDRQGKHAAQVELVEARVLQCEVSAERFQTELQAQIVSVQARVKQQHDDFHVHSHVEAKEVQRTKIGDLAEEREEREGRWGRRTGGLTTSGFDGSGSREYVDKKIDHVVKAVLAQLGEKINGILGKLVTQGGYLGALESVLHHMDENRLSFEYLSVVMNQVVTGTFASEFQSFVMECRVTCCPVTPINVRKFIELKFHNQSELVRQLRAVLMPGNPDQLVQGCDERADAWIDRLKQQSHGFFRAKVAGYSEKDMVEYGINNAYLSSSDKQTMALFTLDCLSDLVRVLARAQTRCSDGKSSFATFDIDRGQSFNGKFGGDRHARDDRQERYVRKSLVPGGGQYDRSSSFNGHQPGKWGSGSNGLAARLSPPQNERSGPSSNAHHVRQQVNEEDEVVMRSAVDGRYFGSDTGYPAPDHLYTVLQGGDYVEIDKAYT